MNKIQERLLYKKIEEELKVGDIIGDINGFDRKVTEIKNCSPESCEVLRSNRNRHYKEGKCSRKIFALNDPEWRNCIWCICFGSRWRKINGKNIYE